MCGIRQSRYDSWLSPSSTAVVFFPGLAGLLIHLRAGVVRAVGATVAILRQTPWLQVVDEKGAVAALLPRGRFLDHTSVHPIWATGTVVVFAVLQAIAQGDKEGALATASPEKRLGMPSWGGVVHPGDPRRRRCLYYGRGRRYGRGGDGERFEKLSSVHGVSSGLGGRYTPAGTGAVSVGAFLSSGEVRRP